MTTISLQSITLDSILEEQHFAGSVTYAQAGQQAECNNTLTSVIIGDSMIKGHSWTDEDGKHFASGSQIARGTGSLAGIGAVQVV